MVLSPVRSEDGGFILKIRWGTPHTSSIRINSRRCSGVEEFIINAHARTRPLCCMWLWIVVFSVFLFASEMKKERLLQTCFYGFMGAFAMPGRTGINLPHRPLSSVSGAVASCAVYNKLLRRPHHPVPDFDTCPPPALLQRRRLRPMGFKGYALGIFKGFLCPNNSIEVSPQTLCSGYLRPVQAFQRGHERRPAAEPLLAQDNGLQGLSDGGGGPSYDRGDFDGQIGLLGLVAAS